ncbi:MAG TPA: phage holin family protein [Thermoanaerobaculia bacterium]
MLQIVLNAVALWLAAHLVPGITYRGGLLQLLVAGLVLGLVNLIVRPIVTFLSLPLILLTLGLFYIVINGFLLWFAAHFMPGLHIAGCLPAILGGLLIALFNWAIRAFAEAD